MKLVRSPSTRLFGEGALVLLISVLYWTIHTPGVFANDSLESWYEGHVGVFQSNQQPLLGALWALLDRLGAGSGGIVMISILLFVTGTYLILRTSFGTIATAVTTIIILALPQIFSQLSIINKETSGGNALLLAAALLLRLRQHRRNVMLLLLAGALAAFAFLMRYQYVVAIVPVFAIQLYRYACTAAAWRDRFRRLAAATAQACAGFFAACAITVALLAINFSVDWGAPFATNLRLQLGYELAALIAHDANAPLDILKADGVDLAALRVRAVADYTPAVNTTLYPMLALLDPAPTSDLARQVSALSQLEPGALSRHHLAVFAELLGLDKVCWPIQSRIIAITPGSM